jgi:pimeloyl-ACP methyl ester carboxylesterase
MLTVTTPLNEFPSGLQRVIPGMRQEKMVDVSHWLHLDRQAEFNAALDRFLATIHNQRKKRRSVCALRTPGER